MSTKTSVLFCMSLGSLMFSSGPSAELIDQTKAPNAAMAGIHKSLQEEIGVGRGDIYTPGSSLFIINRDPFRSIRRGRQLFGRKFAREDGQGPTVGDGRGDINDPDNAAIGAGLTDSCAACHARPTGSAGSGGDVATRPDTRDAPHLFGLGIREMLADEITADLRAIRGRALAEAKIQKRPVTKRLNSKTIDYGTITANPDGSLDTSRVEGIDSDLRVRPFFAHGGTISIREFVVGALQNEMGLQAVDEDLDKAHKGSRVVTPAGMVLDGSVDRIEAPPTNNPAADPDQDGVANEVQASLVDHLEFYLLNYFKPATYRQTASTREGRRIFQRIRCESCHIGDFVGLHDRRVGEAQTVYDPAKGIFNHLFATATALVSAQNDVDGLPPLKKPKSGKFLVRNIFTDFKRHDLGPNFHERNYDGSFRTQFLTTPLWGVGTTAPYGHDGRSINLTEVILRHGGEARESRDAFARLSRHRKEAVLDFLNSLILFPPDHTASNLDPGDRQAPDFPQHGHGSINLSVLFNDPSDLE